VFDWVLAVGNVLIGFVIAEISIAVFNGKRIPVPQVSREPLYLGEGTPLSFVVMGDSTALSTGGDYQQGFAMSSAHHLAKRHRVKFVNLACAGATFKRVFQNQLVIAMELKPDVVFVSAGANDVVRFASRETVRNAAGDIINKLLEANPKVKIIMTGAPDIGTAIRLPQPLRWFAGRRAKQINKILKHLYENLDITYVPIFEKVCPAFKKNLSLFASDKFHPTTEGYKVWTSVIIGAFDEALER
jgi:acyl-CoA thioesterase I